MKKTISIIVGLCLMLSLFGTGFTTLAATTTDDAPKTVQLVLNSAGTAFKVPDGVTVYVGDTIKFDPDTELLIEGTPTKLSSLTKWHVHYDRDNFPIQYQYYTTNPEVDTYLESLVNGEFVVNIAGNYYSQAQWWIGEQVYSHTYFETFSAVERPRSAKVIDMVLNDNKTAFKIPDGVTVSVGDTVRFDPEAEIYINGFPTKMSTFEKFHVHYSDLNSPIIYQYFTSNIERSTYLPKLESEGSFPILGEGKYFSQVQWWVGEQAYSYAYFEPFEVFSSSTATTGVTSDGFKYENYGSVCKITDYNGYSTSVTVPSQINGVPVFQIAERTFVGSPILQEVTISEGIREIGQSAFAGTKIKQVSIPKTLIRIGNQAFTNCSQLEQITVHTDNHVYKSSGNCIVEIDTKTLVQGCKNSVIPFDSSVTVIGESAFSGSGITSVLIPSTITTIEPFAFYNCYYLSDLTVSNGVTNIGLLAFGGCYSLENVLIPKSVTKVSPASFAGCNSINTLIVQEGNPVYHSNGNCIIQTASKTLVVTCPLSIIPSDGSVTAIGDYAFMDSSITEISIPNTVEIIKNDAFYNCNNLSKLIIPDSVTTIEDYALSTFSDLEVEIHDSVTSIGNNAFYNVKKIKCYENSTISEWAKQNGVSYEIITPLYGDVTSDKSIDIFDLIALAKYITNPSTVVNIRTANTTANDSSIDIFDLISLAKHIVDPTTVLGPTA